MYAVDPAAVQAFWTHLREALIEAGLPHVPAALCEPEDLNAHWRSRTLLLSQSCGFPFVTSLAGHVRYVATPCFAAPGCEGACYRSAVMVRADEPAETLAAMAGRRAAFNGRDSQSGYNGLRALVAPLAVEGRFFGSTFETGSHRRSLRAVATGAADLAAIDVVTLALIGDHAPNAVSRLRILCHTEPVPGLPLITGTDTSDADLSKLRQAVGRACRSNVAARALRLTGAEVLPVGAYDIILAQRDAAVRCGYGELA